MIFCQEIQHDTVHGKYGRAKKGGVLTSLAGLLKSDNAQVQVSVIGALTRLAINCRDSMILIVNEAGVLTSLGALLKSVDTQVLTEVTGLLASLASKDFRIKTLIGVERGVLASLDGLLRSKEAQVRANAKLALKNIKTRLPGGRGSRFATAPDTTFGVRKKKANGRAEGSSATSATATAPDTTFGVRKKKANGSAEGSSATSAASGPASKC